MTEFKNLTKKRVDIKTIKKLCDKILPKRFLLSVVIASPHLMRRLNRQYRGKNKTANTLSFLLEKEKGEIFLNSSEKNMPYLFVHSALHLLGFDHRSKKSTELMARKEFNILESK